MIKRKRLRWIYPLVSVALIIFSFVRRDYFMGIALLVTTALVVLIDVVEARMGKQ